MCSQGWDHCYSNPFNFIDKELEAQKEMEMVKVAELPVGHVLVMSGEGMELGDWFPATNRTVHSSL